MKAVVIYQSKTGFTRKYAQWIAEELGADLYSKADVRAEDLGAYDIVVYGGGLYAVGINGIKFIKRNLDKLKGKKVAVFACGCTPTREETTGEIRDMNFSLEEQEYIEFFYLRGGFNYSKLTVWDKILMTLLKLKLKTRRNPSADERGMLAVYARPADFTSKKNIADLVDYLKS